MRDTCCVVAGAGPLAVAARTGAAGAGMLAAVAGVAGVELPAASGNAAGGAVSGADVCDDIDQYAMLPATIASAIAR
jgi:hypothetical protein